MNRRSFPDGLVVRIRRSHRRGRGSIPRLGERILNRCRLLYWKAIAELFKSVWLRDAHHIAEVIYHANEVSPAYVLRAFCRKHHTVNTEPG